MKKKDILSDGIGQINDSILERFDRIDRIYTTIILYNV